MTSDRLRIALLAHSTNPRGGVVHAIELAESLVRMGHEAIVHAPAKPGATFFRPSTAKTVVVPATPVAVVGDLHSHVLTRIDDYIRYFSEPKNRRFDVFHAGDGLSANALAALRDAGLIPAYARTVHHLDRFADPRVTDLDRRSIQTADVLFTVSAATRDEVRQTFRRSTTVVGNGVNQEIFSAARNDADQIVAARIEDLGGPVFLSVGGIEERKNSRIALAAFLQLRTTVPSARWVIAGGASLIDHASFAAAFDRDLAAAGLPDTSVVRLGPVEQDLMPALYRRADALLFPSVIEGFGLAVLEAMACGTPAIVSRAAPFTDYLTEGDVAWCDPFDATSITAAMLQTLDSDGRTRLVINGFGVADRHDWKRTAEAHLPIYQQLRETAYA